MDTKVLNMKGEEVKSLKLSDAVFGVKPKITFLHEVVIATLANRRSGSAETLRRGEVSGGGRKPWKQKHTGRARAGSNRSGLWRKGGVIFGPHARSYRQYLGKTKLRAALTQALSARVSEGALQVVDSLSIEKPKTSSLAAILNALKVPYKKSLVVLDAKNAALTQAGHNLAGVTLTQAADLNAYDVLNCHRIIITEAALNALTKSLS
jgi:large subunit ribosomal protein L4